MNYDNVSDTTTGTGTGALPLSGTPPAGYRAFTGLINSFGYKIKSSDGSQWEIGVGSISGSNLTRATILRNHLGTTAAVNFSAGTKTVSLVLLSSRTIDVNTTTTNPPTATGTDAIAAGSGASATGTEAVALGLNAVAAGANTVALGRGSTSGSGVGNVALVGGTGGGNNYAIAIGNSSYAGGQRAIAFTGAYNSKWDALGIGYYCTNNNHGTITFCGTGGWSSQNGYGQVMIPTWWAQTGTATPVVMEQGTQGGNEFLLQTKSVKYFDITVVAIGPGPNYHSVVINFKGAVYRGTGDPAFLGTPTKTVVHQSAGFTVDANITAVPNVLKLTVTGLASTSINWHASGMVIEANTNQ